MSIREDVRNLLEGIELIMPSRNIITQIIMLLPMEEHKILELFPQLTKDEPVLENLKKALGISIVTSNGIKTWYVSYGSLGYMLKNLIEGFFELLHNKETKNSLETLYGKKIEDYEREWLEARIKPFIDKKAISKIALPYLKLLLNTGNVTEELIAQKTGLDYHDVKILTYYLESLKLIEKHNGHITLSLIAMKYRNFLINIIKNKGDI